MVSTVELSRNPDALVSIVRILEISGSQVVDASGSQHKDTKIETTLR